jgi:flagellar assembly protein FliH
MSDTIKLSFQKNGIKARVPGQKDNIPNFADFDEEKGIWKRRIEDSHSKGYDEGYQRASDEIKTNYENEFIRKSEEYYNILSTFEKELEEYSNSFNEIVIQVTKKIAEKILQREIKDHSTIESILKVSLSKVLGANEVIIKLNSTDYKYLDTDKHREELEQNFSKIKFEKDSGIPVGGCVIETAIGNVDGRINTQLNEIFKQLENEILNNI